MHVGHKRFTWWTAEVTGKAQVRGIADHIRRYRSFTLGQKLQTLQDPVRHRTLHGRNTQRRTLKH